MAILFSVKDKAGKLIYLSKERWKHIQKHPEMTDQIEQIKDTLIRPDIVTTIEYDPSIRFFYRYFKNRKNYLFISVNCRKFSRSLSF